MRRWYWWLRLTLLALSIPAVIGLGVNQWGAFYVRGRATSVLVEECERFKSDGVQIDGVAYCVRWVEPNVGYIAAPGWLRENVEP